MKFWRKTWTMLIALVMVSMMCLSAYAATSVIWIGGYGDWSQSYSVSRRGGSDPAAAKCDSVYPEWGPDFFGKMYCRVVNSSGKRISEDSFVLLDEGWSGYTSINLLQGYQNDTSIDFQFCGHNDYLTANAVVSYLGNYPS